MNNPELLVVLLVGTVLMSGIIAIQMKWYNIPQWKSLIVSIILLLTGYFGSHIWYYIENGAFTGRSFYGAVFLSPIVFFAVAKAINVPYGITMDLVAPGGCLTLALVKIQCFRDGCCAGIPLYVDKNHNYVKFPSQLVEMVAFLVVAIILLRFCKRGEQRGYIFPWFMTLYGASRFVLNFFRSNSDPYALGLSAGAFWSVLAFLIGTIVLISTRNKVTKDE